MSEPTLRERLATLEAKIDQVLEIKEDLRFIKTQCPQHSETIAAHEARIKALEASVNSLWGRAWWFVGLAATSTFTLIGIALKYLFEMIFKKP